MVKLVIIAFICAGIIIYLRSINSEITMLAMVGAGIIVLFFSIEYIVNIFDFFNNVIELSGIDRNVFEIIFKITAISYLIEFSSDTLVDFGLKSISDKLCFVGKLVIFTMSMPIIYSVLNLLINLLQ